MPDGPATPQLFNQGAAQPGQSDASMAMTPTTPMPDVPTASSQMPTLAPAPPSAQQTDSMHHSMIGKAARFLLGNQVEYQTNPQTGQVQEVKVPQKPGSMFRSLVAGAILGGAAGAETHKGEAGGFLPSFARGAQAANAQQQQMAQQRYARAQQDYENGLKMSREQREENSAKSEEQVRSAQIAHLNAATLHENFLLQSAEFDHTLAAAEAGKKMLEPFQEAGAEVKFSDVGEGDMQKIMTTDPRNAALSWMQTGVKAAVDKDGKPYLEKTYSAIDPKGKIKVSQGMIDNYNAVEMSKYHPDMKKLRVGQEISADDAVRMNTLYMQRKNEKLVQDKTDLDTEDKKASIKEKKAQAAHYFAEAANSKLAADDKKMFSSAMDAYKKVDYDWDKLDAASQVVIADKQSQIIKDMNDTAKAMISAGDLNGATEELKNASNLSRLVPKALAGKSGKQTQTNADGVQKVVDDVSGKGTTFNQNTLANDSSEKLSPTAAYRKILASNLSPAEKMDAARKAGAVVPWDVIESTARQNKIPASQVVDELEKQGIKVEQSPVAKAGKGVDRMRENLGP